MLRTNWIREATVLREKLNNVLFLQGFAVGDHGITAISTDRESKRDLHKLAKSERMQKHKDFLLKNVDLISNFSLNGRDLDVAQIKPRLIEVKSGTKQEIIFKWWNMVWWSLPYERAYGRQMRWLVWDDYHHAPIGLIGLQSPILSWSVRDKLLNIPYDTRDYWVNQSLSAQRLGALPPYNTVLGGKLIGMLLTSDKIRKAFAKKYKGISTVMQNRKIPARLLFITTTGAFGKSSVYNRLKFRGETVAQFIGYSSGNGSFHIPDSLYGELLKFLDKTGQKTTRGYGSGPSRKMRLIGEALNTLGIPNGTNHGVKRAVYYFPMANNIKEIIGNSAKPIWNERGVKEMTAYWKERWAIPRSKRTIAYKDFNYDDFLHQTLMELNNSTLFDSQNEKVDYATE